MHQGCTNSSCLVVQASKFFVVVPNIFSIIIASFFLTYNNVYRFTCTKQEVPGSSDNDRALQNCGCAVWNLLRVTVLVPRFWRGLLEFWKIFRLLTNTFGYLMIMYIC
jgi:hypothetical protein